VRIDSHQLDGRRHSQGKEEQSVRGGVGERKELKEMAPLTTQEQLPFSVILITDQPFVVGIREKRGNSETTGMAQRCSGSVASRVLQGWEGAIGGRET
jgi:hypothetical protein